MLSIQVKAQTDFDEHIETLPIFGLSLMPNQESFLSLEADYDGMFFSERELADFFVLSRFSFSDELVDWTYYDYWINNNRGGIDKVPYDHMFYNLVVDAQASKFAVYLKSKKEYNTEVILYDLGSQAQIAVFDVFNLDENVEHINFLKFDADGTRLLIGTESHGSFIYDVATAQLSKMDITDNLQLIDYSYESKAMYFAPFTMDDFGEITYGEGFVMVDDTGKKPIDAYPLVLDHTKMFTPTQMNKLFKPFYRQDYDTYFTTKEGSEQTILYRNLKTFKLISTEQPIDIW